VLLIAAGAVIARHQGTFVGAVRAAAGSPLWLICLCLLLPLMNWISVSMSFWVMTRRYGPVGPGEMSALIGGAWLLNYLPLRPGLIGRLAYHRSVNEIPLKHSVLVIAINSASTGVCALVMITIAILLPGGSRWPVWAAALAAPPLAMGLVAAGLAPRGGHAWRYWANMVLRYIDLLAWVARYAAVFALIGRPISLPLAVAAATASQLAMLVPIVGNGLGLREWAIGLTIGAAPAAARILGAGEISTADTPSALTADLINRAAELAVAIPVGLA